MTGLASAEPTLIRFRNATYSHFPFASPGPRKVIRLVHRHRNSSISASADNAHCVRTSVCAVILLLLVLTGCAGKSIKEDNPVFAAAPPRRSLSNNTAGLSEPRFAMSDDGSAIRRVSHGTETPEPLTGTTVVCEVNGNPIFVDDLLGGMRQMLETDPRLTDADRDRLLRSQIAKRLPHYVEQEIVLDALRKKVPEEQRNAISDSLEPEFQRVISSIMTDRNLQSEEQLAEALAGEGMTIDLLRQAFQRVQLVNGFLHTLAESPSSVEREDMLTFYREHKDDYTTGARIRVSEISVSFDENDGRAGAEKQMARVVLQIQKGADFSKLATAMSDSLTSERGGDMGWIQRGTLTDADLESELFEMPAGTTTRVITRSNRFEVYRVTEREEARTQAFTEVQGDIEAILIREQNEAARKLAFEKLKERSTVVSMLEGIDPFPTESNPVVPVSATR